MQLPFLNPGHFSQYFISAFVGTESLTFKEMAIIENSAQKRKLEFSTGRFCAKKAMEAFGIFDAEILRGEAKEPLWPEGIVGSISHSKMLAGAVVARVSKVRSIGLDIETIGGVKPDMWALLYTQNEQNFLDGLPKTHTAIFATLLFSLKESFYKFQYPLTRLFVNFLDVELNYQNNKFSITMVNKDLFEIGLPPIAPDLKWLQFENQVISICYLYN